MEENVTKEKVYFFESPQNPNTLGIFIKNKRKERGLTLKQIEDSAKINQGTLSNIERGTFRSPSIYNLKILSDFYEVPFLDLAKMIDIPNEAILEYIRIEQEKADVQ